MKEKTFPPFNDLSIQAERDRFMKLKNENPALAQQIINEAHKNEIDGTLVY
ncbi:MAG: hypothetical protein WCK11_02750 [Candidatus Falkowbacteria bacterium]